MMCTEVDTMSGTRRPILSDHGPTSSWPTPKPMVVAVSVSWMAGVETPKSLCSVGQRRQVRVDRERSECGQSAQDQDVGEALAAGERVSGMHDGGHEKSPWRVGGGRGPRPPLDARQKHRVENAVLEVPDLESIRSGQGYE